MKEKRSFNTSEVARFCHVSPDTIRDWANRGMLGAFRTPGGHRRITRESLIRFLKEQNMPIDAELMPHKRRVLIVDDEVSVADALAKLVRAIDPEVEVDVANSGFDAGKMLHSTEPDVVLLDLRMPGLDGFDVCRQIKADERTRHITVIAMTAYYGEPEANEIIRLGAVTCLRKPLDLDTVRTALGTTLGAMAM